MNTMISGDNSAGKDKVQTEYDKVQAELNEKDLIIRSESARQIRKRIEKMEQIDEKGQCVSVRFLDRLADAIEFSGKRIANKIRGLTFNISAPCSIPFIKKK